MKHLTEILIDNGFTKQRKVFTGKYWKYIDSNFKGFSSMVNGGLDVRYIKGDVEIIYGLSESNKPPTLICPRPNIRVYKNGKFAGGEQLDDVMNLCLSKENHLDIFKAMFDKSITFKYEIRE